MGTWGRSSEVGTLAVPGAFKDQKGGQWGEGRVGTGSRETMALALAFTPSGTGVTEEFLAEGCQELTYIFKGTLYH